MPAYNDTIDDFNLKWANTWAYLKDEIVYIYGAEYAEDEEHSKNYYVTLSNSEQKKKCIPNFNLSSLTPILFDSQFFNCDFSQNWQKTSTPACLFIARTPRRQNKRSISDENTTIFCPLMSITSKITSSLKRSYNLSKEHIDRVLTQTFPTYLQALDLCNDHLVVALSKNFAVSLSTISKEKYLLMNQFGFIGETDTNNLYIYHQGSVQEINDFVNRNALNLRVINANNT